MTVIYKIIPAKRIPPSIRLSFPSRNIRHKINVTRMLSGISLFKISRFVLNADKKAHTPTTTNPLKIFDPTTLLTASVLFPASDAVTLTAHSGRLVPIATIVIPIIMEGM